MESNDIENEEISSESPKSEAESPNSDPKFKQISDRVKKWGPLVGFLGGVGWDSWTLGRVVSTLDLWILGGYLFVGLLSTLLFNRKWQKWGILAYHFCVGTLLSALVILYAKSAASIGSFAVVGAVALLMVFNEFWGENRFDQTFRNILLWLVSTMYFQFLLPHIFESISILWFLLALICSNSFILGFAKLQKSPFKKWAIGFSVIWLFLWIVNLFPPIPLVVKDQFVGSDINTSDYSAKSLAEDSHFNTSLIELPKGVKVSYLSSIFAPKDVTADLEHRWWWVDPQGHKKLIDTVKLKLRKGGREKGWRFYSWKQNMLEGNWVVETAVQDGPVISRMGFEFRFADWKDKEKTTNAPVNISTHEQIETSTITSIDSVPKAELRKLD